MKKIIVWTLGIILILGSIALFSYPFVSNYLMSIKNESAVVKYLDTTRRYPDELYKKLRKKANAYNEKLVGDAVVSEDPFSVDIDNENTGDMLKIDESQIISVIDIPKLELNLPVFYGTTEEVLGKGIGLMEKTSLPVGGEGTHAVFTGHTGYGGLRLFTDLEALEIGDVFYVMTLGETLAYEVDNIAVVLPHETELLRIDSQKDYATMVTCTPYGKNTHRLLVRGKRVNEKDIPTEKLIKKAESRWEKEYSKAIKIGVSVMTTIIAVFVIIRLILWLIKRKRKKDEKNNS